jgi:hypothetical protein
MGVFFFFFLGVVCCKLIRPIVVRCVLDLWKARAGEIDEGCLELLVAFGNGGLCKGCQ